MNRPFGKALHSRFLDYPWNMGIPYDNALYKYLSGLLVLHLNSRIRHNILQVVGKNLADIIDGKLAELNEGYKE